MRTTQTGDYKLRHEASHSGYSHNEISRLASGGATRKIQSVSEPSI